MAIMTQCCLKLSCFNVIPSELGTREDKLKAPPATVLYIAHNDGWNCWCYSTFSCLLFATTCKSNI